MNPQQRHDGVRLGVGLALGAVGALAAVGVLRRGSRSNEPRYCHVITREKELPPQVPSSHQTRMAYLLSLNPRVGPLKGAPLALRSFRSYIEENGPWEDSDAWAIWGQIPSEQAKRIAWESLEDKVRWSGFDEYHAWYISMSDVPNYEPLNRWPSMVNLEEDEELFRDGWHRFHSYIRSGHAAIPFYAVVSKEIGLHLATRSSLCVSPLDQQRGDL